MSPTQPASFTPSRLPYPLGYVTVPGSNMAFCALPFLNPSTDEYGYLMPGANQAIANAKSSPVSFSQSTEGTTLQGIFGDWKIAEGGDGELLRLSIPVTSWTLTTPESKTITGNLFTLEVELPKQWAYPPMSWVQPEDAPRPVPPSEYIVAVVNLDFGTNIPTGVVGVLCSRLLASWVQANQPAVQHVVDSIIKYAQTQ